MDQFQLSNSDIELCFLHLPLQHSKQIFLEGKACKNISVLLVIFVQLVNLEDCNEVILISLVIAIDKAIF